MKNSKISRRIEPMMHLVALGFAIGTAIVGAVVDIYGEKAGAMSCWMSRDSKEGTSGSKETAESAMVYDIIGTVFFALPVLAVFICLVINNVVIYLFVRRHIRKHPSQETEDSTPGDVDVSFAESSDSSKGSSRIANSTKKTSRRESKNKDNISKRKIASQSQRLQLVCSQAFLFVMAFMVCNAWNSLMGILPGSDLKDIELMVKYYPLAVLQAALLPLQGLFNVIIFLRPKYLKLRLSFPREGRFWTVRRIFLGDKLRPTVCDGYKLDAQSVTNRGDEPRSEADAPVGDTGTSRMAQSRLPHNMISSLTGSEGNFDDDSDILDEDDRWHDVSPQGNQNSPACFASSRNRTSSLGAISELSESVFDLTPYQANGSHLSVASAGMPAPTESSESRWKDGSTSAPVTAPPRPALSTVESSEDDLLDGIERRSLKTDSRMEVPRRKCDASVDMPIQVPIRTSDVLKVSNDSPISVPKRTSDTPVDPPTLSYSSGSDDPSVLDPEKLTRRDIGPRRKMAYDMPLARPSRFVSLPHSEVEDA
ncbi:unnamed protein product [Cylindrotheca closterium]|uniref:Uncharacterized protein n=1 Tax=Cylindrotheca closterium TaxID=2856 RepID=A0AAD2CPV8_9STRA|nr:unnamed protein product [Cylindrotheca closterium]